MIKKHLSINALIVCSLGAIFYCYEYLLRIEPSVMVNELMKRYDLAANHFGLFASLYYLAYTPLQLFVGLIFDAYPARYVMTLATFTCALGSLLFSLSDQLLIASIGRFLIGMGSAFAFVGALKLANDYLPKNKFSLFSSIITSLGMLGGFVGNIALTYLVTKFGWLSTLVCTTMLGFILLVPMWQLLRNHSSNENNGIDQKTKRRFIANITGVIKNSTIWKIGLAGSLSFTLISVFAELWGISFLKNTYHLSAQDAAFANSLIFLGWVAGGPINGYFSDRFENKASYFSVGSFIAIPLITAVIFLPLSKLAVETCLFLLGAVCSTQTLCFVLARDMSAKNLEATNIAVVNIIVMLGGLLIQPLLGFLLHLANLYQPSIYAYKIVFGIFPLLFLASAMVSKHVGTRIQSQSLLPSTKFSSLLPPIYLLFSRFHLQFSIFKLILSRFYLLLSRIYLVLSRIYLVLSRIFALLSRIFVMLSRIFVLSSVF